LTRELELLQVVPETVESGTAASVPDDQATAVG
jgi:hypothetical protein